MKLTFLGAAHEVTGSCTLLEACGKKMLIDFGMEQGPDIYENCEIPVSPAEIDFVFLTHAHIDHSGKLPLLTKNGFRGRIRLRQPGVFAPPCLQTRHISRNPRRCGKTGGQSVRAKKAIRRCIRLRTCRR